MTPQTSVPAGMRMSATLRVAQRLQRQRTERPASGASSRWRRPRRSRARRSRRASTSAGSPATRVDLGARARQAVGMARTAARSPRPASWRWCPRRRAASSARCRATSLGRDPRLPGRRRRRSSPRAGSSARRGAPDRRRGGARAAATKPSIAALTAATLRSSSRSAADFHQRQVGNGANMRRNIAGKILSRCCWMTSSSDSSVLTSAPKARPAIVSTVKRIRSACRSIGAPARAARPQRAARRSLTATSAGK